MIKIAQIGVGYWGPNLLRNLLKNKNFDLKLVVDKSQQRLDYVKSLYPNIKVSLDSDIIFNDKKIDAVVISTPANSHYSLAMRALKSGKHILVEKPMATSSGEVEKIEILANRNNLIAMSGHTFIYNSAVDYLKTLIDNGDLGDIRCIYSQRLNLGRIRQDVDALWNFAPHDVSIIQHLLGNPTPFKVSRSGMDFIQEGIDDIVFLNIKYQNNIFANIHVSWLDPLKVRKLIVLGSKKMVVYDDVSTEKIKIYNKFVERRAILGENMDFDKSSSFQFNYESGNILIPKLNITEPLQNQIQHFSDCIIKNDVCKTGTQHTKMVIKILEMD